MTPLRLSNKLRLFAFLLLVAAIISIETAVTRSPAFVRHPVGVSLAVFFDLVFITTALFYWLVARPLGLAVSRLVVVALVMVRVALFILPETALLPHQLWPLLLGLVEGAVLIIAGLRIRAIIRTYRQLRPSTDAETALRLSLSVIFGHRVATFLIGEGQVFYYIVFGWRLHSDVPREAKLVTVHQQSGQIALTVTLIIVGSIEVIAVHLLVARWHPTVAFWLTVASVYGLLFFVADAIATIKRPSYLTTNQLHVRLGIRWRATIDRSAITQVTFIHETPAKQAGRLSGTFLTAPNVLLTFDKPIVFQGPYGIQREVREFSFFVDNREQL